MSFRCQKCGKAQPPGTRPNRVVTKRREVVKGQYDPPVMQIAEEQNLCDLCAVIEPKMPPLETLDEVLGE